MNALKCLTLASYTALSTVMDIPYPGTVLQQYERFLIIDEELHF